MKGGKQRRRRVSGIRARFLKVSDPYLGLRLSCFAWRRANSFFLASPGLPEIDSLIMCGLGDPSRFLPPPPADISKILISAALIIFSCAFRPPDSRKYTYRRKECTNYSWTRQNACAPKNKGKRNAPLQIITTSIADRI